MKVGDVVINREGPWSNKGAALRSGAEHYTHAICVSVEPFAMVSQEGDMLWTQQDPENLLALCEASPAAAEKAMARWAKEVSKKAEKIDTSPQPVEAECKCPQSVRTFERPDYCGRCGLALREDS